MKKMFLMILAAGTLFGNAVRADDAEAKETRFRPLRIDSSTVVLEKVQARGGGMYLVELSFSIQPESTCAENYAGVTVDRNLAYQVVYSTKMGERCGAFGASRRVSHAFEIRLTDHHLQQAGLRLNGTDYLFQRQGSEVKLISKSAE